MKPYILGGIGWGLIGLGLLLAVLGNCMGDASAGTWLGGVVIMFFGMALAEGSKL